MCVWEFGGFQTHTKSAFYREEKNTCTAPPSRGKVIFLSIVRKSYYMGKEEEARFPRKKLSGRNIGVALLPPVF